MKFHRYFFAICIRLSEQLPILFSIFVSQNCLGITFMATTTKEMTEGAPLPLILNFTFPLLLGNILQQTYSLVDAAIVGKFLGINDLAAIGASTSVVFLILGFCNGCCCGFGIPVAQKFGARDYKTMRRYVTVSLQLAALMSIVIAVLTSVYCADILRSMQTPENIFHGAYYYLLVTFIGVPCTFFYNLLSSIIRALGDSKTPFWFLLFSTVLNIVLDLFCILVLGWGVLAQKFGARDYKTMRRYVTVSLQLAALMSIVIAVLTSVYCADILRSMQTPENIFHGAYYYLLVTFIGVPCTFFYNLLSSIIRALGDSKTPFWFLLFSTVLNIVLDLFCILVLGWGVLGAGIATVVSQGVSALLCYFYMYKHFPVLKGTADDRKFRFPLAKNLLYIGVPMGLQFSITAIGSILLQSANNALGTACVAAFTAAMRIKMFFICAFESLGIAMATYTGQNYGARKPERIWQGIKASSLLMMIYAVFTFTILMSASDKISLLFVDASETEILKNTVLFLHVSCYFFPILGLLCILRYTIQGAGYTNLAMLSGVSEMIARTLVSIYAVPIFGFLAVCFGDPTAWIAADLFLVPAFIYVYRKLKKSLKENYAIPNSSTSNSSVE